MANEASIIPRTISAPVGPQIDPRAAAMPGQALTDVGDAATNFVQAQYQAQDQAQLIQSRLAAAQQIDDLHQKYLTDPDPSTAVARFKEAADAVGAQQLESIKTPQNRSAFNLDVGQMIEGRRVSLQEDVYHKQQESAVADVLQGAETYSRQAAYAPNDVARTAAITAFQGSVAGVVTKGMMNAEEAQKITQGFSEKLSLYDGRSLVNRSPDLAARKLTDPNFLPTLDPLARVELQNQAQTEIRVREREARAAMAESRANASEALSDFNNIIGSGLPPSQAVLDQTRAAVRASGDPRLAEKFAGSIRAAGFASQLRGATPQEVEGAINTIDTQAAAGGVDSAAASAEKGARTYLAKMNHGLAQDPLDWASKNGVVNVAPLKLDGSDNSVAWQQRMRAADLAAQHYGVKPRYLTQDEMQKVGNQLDMSQPADARLKAVHMLVDNMGPRALSVLGDLSTAPHPGRAFGTGQEHFDALGGMATAGGLLSDGPAYVSTARDIANGEAAMRARPELKPQLQKFTGVNVNDGAAVGLQQLAQAFKQMPQDYSRVVTAAQAIYAKRAGDAGLTGTDVGTKGAPIMAAALDAAAGAHYVDGKKRGGLTLYNSAPVIAPNMINSDSFEDLMHHLNANDLARASVTGAAPMIDGKPTGDDLVKHSWLVSAGNNRYAISTTDPSQGAVTSVRDANGRIYKIDFAKALPLLQARAAK